MIVIYLCQASCHSKAACASDRLCIKNVILMIENVTLRVFINIYSRQGASYGYPQLCFHGKSKENISTFS